MNSSRWLIVLGTSVMLAACESMPMTPADLQALQQMTGQASPYSQALQQMTGQVPLYPQGSVPYPGQVPSSTQPPIPLPGQTTQLPQGSVPMYHATAPINPVEQRTGTGLVTPNALMQYGNALLPQQ